MPSQTGAPECADCAFRSKRLQKQAPMRFAVVEATGRERQPTGDAGLELIMARGERLRISSGMIAQRVGRSGW